MAKNTYRVPKKQWMKWSKPQQAMFNQLFFALKDQYVIKHPEMEKVPDVYWKTIRWNAAWLAASAYVMKDYFRA